MELPHRLHDDRPWGSFDQFTQNEPSTVKIITVLPGQAFSLQSHKDRDEFWRIIEGSGIITLNDEKKTAHVGDEYFISRGVAHRAEAGEEPLIFLEIAFGNFDENDITRIEDRYGRS